VNEIDYMSFTADTAALPTVPRSQDFKFCKLGVRFAKTEQTSRKKMQE
jgi:hypothetical protein